MAAKFEMPHSTCCALLFLSTASALPSAARMRALQMSRLQERTARARGSRDNWLAERHVKRVMAAGLYVIVRCCSSVDMAFCVVERWFSDVSHPGRSCVVGLADVAAEKKPKKRLFFCQKTLTLETPLQSALNLMLDVRLYFQI